MHAKRAHSLTSVAGAPGNLALLLRDRLRKQQPTKRMLSASNAVPDAATTTITTADTRLCPILPSEGDCKDGGPPSTHGLQ